MSKDALTRKFTRMDIQKEYDKYKKLLGHNKAIREITKKFGLKKVIVNSSGQISYFECLSRMTKAEQFLDIIKSKDEAKERTYDLLSKEIGELFLTSFSNVAMLEAKFRAILQKTDSSDGKKALKEISDDVNRIQNMFKRIKIK